MLKEGDQSPDFLLKDDLGKPVQLSQFKGQSVVLFFYPKDDTPGCTKEAIAFSEKLSEFEAHNTIVLGISKDSVESHKKFSEKYSLKVQLLSDPDLTVMKSYGVWREKKNYGKSYMGVVRTTFLIKPDGLIEKIWNNVRVNGHSEKVFSEACPVLKEGGQ